MLNVPGKQSLLLCLLLVSLQLVAGTASRTFQVSAVITGGCALGSGSEGNNDAQFGTINFGERSAIPSNIDVASSRGAGSLIVTCTPGIGVTLSLDYGLNGGNSSARYLINGSGSRKLAYQLYQDAGHSSIWGTGAQAKTIASFPAGSRMYTVYARLFSVSTPPPAGTYTDTVTVTLTY
ncbi:spore coat U domain-containing protein [uncultured Pluralibacter sp.]|uniref:Csu type fimbrial protein n=1 Tax=uncultured Pluralibacter sp. TaxID=1490864 RepID=UPI0026220509|nr:spore coat U domain-containing protein [uncultured Pluralibacter sp.]